MRTERLAAREDSTEAATVVVVRATDGSRGPFERRLRTCGAIERVETATRDRAADALAAARPDGVVCLAPGDSTGETPAAGASAAPGGPVDAVDTLAAGVADTAAPILVVGTGVDAAAAYAVGADEVVPVDPDGATEVAVDRIAAALARHREARAARAAREETERVLARIDEAVLALDDDWRVGYANERAGELFEIDPAEAVGRVVWEAIPGVVDTAFERKARNAMETRYPLSTEAELAALDGRFAIDVYPDEAGLSVFLEDVTERTERRRELRVRRRAMDEASVPLTLSDPSRPDNPLVYVNEAFEEITGYDREEALGRNCRFLQGPGTDRETVAEIAAAVDAEEPISAEILNYRPDGTPFRNRLDIAPIYGEDGTLLRFVGSQRDVTDEHRRRRTREELLATSRELLDADAPPGIAGTVSDAARSILGHELNAVCLREGDRAALRPVAWTDGIDELFDGPREPVPDGPVWAALERGEATIVDDLAGEAGPGSHRDTGTGDEEPVSADDNPYAPVVSLLALPLGDHGVLVVGGTDPGAFDEADVATGELLTLSATAALDRLARDRELREYETLFEAVRDELYVVDGDGYVRLVTAPLADALGYDRGTLCGRHVSTVLTEGTIEEGRRLVGDLLETPDAASATYEGTMVTRDGEQRPVEIELSLLPHEDGFRGTVGAVRGISRHT